MPDDIQDALGTEEADPLSDPQEGGDGTADDQTPIDGQDGSEGEPEGQLIEGTPYKDQAALVTGYKEIQRLVSNKDRQIKQLTRQLDAAAQSIMKLHKPNSQQAATSQVPQGDEFWKAFSQDPIGMIEKIFMPQLEKFYSEKVDPRLAETGTSVSQLQRTNLVNGFLAGHPELTSEDEDAMVEILDKNPQLKEIPDGLEIAYDRVVAARSRATSRQSAAAGAVGKAKQVAGLAGKKTSLPAQKQQGDEFDDVLSLDKNEQALYSLGRKKS
jgi:hypothetical protein